MKEIINFLRILWEFPQSLLGFILFQFYGVGCQCMEAPYGDVRILYSERMRGGISLGRFIILPWKYRYNSSAYVRDTISHEYGHTRQSLCLGWLYLVVIGLPSLLWAWAHSTFKRLREVDYYSFYTERWADDIGGLRR